MHFIQISIFLCCLNACVHIQSICVCDHTMVNGWEGLVLFFKFDFLLCYCWSWCNWPLNMCHLNFFCEWLLLYSLIVKCAMTFLYRFKAKRNHQIQKPYGVYGFGHVICSCFNLSLKFTLDYTIVSTNHILLLFSKSSNHCYLAKPHYSLAHILPPFWNIPATFYFECLCECSLVKFCSLNALCPPLPLSMRTTM